MARWGKLNCPDAAALCTLTIATSPQAIVDQRQSEVKVAATPVVSTPGAYSSESLGIALQLPEGWSKSAESVADGPNRTKVLFSKRNSYCSLTVVRYHLQATQDTFNKLSASGLQSLDGAHELSSTNVTRDGLTGTRTVVNYENDKVEWHAILETFTAGDIHYQLVAEAPLDDFQLNSAELDKLFASVRFPASRDSQRSTLNTRSTRFTPARDSSSAVAAARWDGCRECARPFVHSWLGSTPNDEAVLGSTKVTSLHSVPTIRSLT